MSLSHDLHQLLPYYGITVHETRDTTHYKRERHGWMHKYETHTANQRLFPKAKLNFLCNKASGGGCRAHTRAVRLLSNPRAPVAKIAPTYSDSRRVIQAALRVAEAGTGSWRLPRQQRTLADSVDVCVCWQHLPPRKCGSVPRSKPSDSVLLRSRYDEGIRHIVN